MGTSVLRIGLGAIIGVQASGLARKVIPASLANSSNMIVLILAAVYLMWGGRPQGEAGDVVDGIAIGIASITAAAVVKLPIPA